MIAATTLADLRGQVRAKLSEGGTGFFDDTFVNGWINEALDKLAERCPWLAESIWQTETVPNAPAYTMPEELIEPTAVSGTLSSGVGFPIDYVQPGEMSRAQGFGKPTTSTPWYATCELGTDGLAIVLWPTPSTRFTLAVRGYRKPKKLVADTDVVELRTKLLPALNKYALWQAKVKDEELGQAQAAERDWLRELDGLAAERTRKQAIRMNATRRSMSLRSSPWAGR